MSSYKEIQQQIEVLQRQAEEARKREVAEGVAEIKRIMTERGITLADLGCKQTRRAAGAEKNPRYRDPVSGATWTGNGRKPEWIKKALAEGKSLEQFAI